MATIQQRKQRTETTYRVRWWAGDKQRSKTFTTYTEARRFKALLEGDIANGTYIDPKQGQVTVMNYATKWLPTVIDLRPSTRQRIEQCLTHVLDEFGSLPVSGVTHAHVASWVAAQTKQWSVASVRKQAFTLRRMMQAAVHEGIIRTNPVDGVRLPAEKHYEQRYLDKAEIDRLVMAINPRYRAMVLLAIYGGFRYGELTALRRENIDPARSAVRVTQTLVDIKGTLTFGPPKTKSSVRTVTVPRSVMAALVEHMNTYTASSSDSLVFTYRNGGPVRRSSFRPRVWLPATTAAGLEGLRFHDLRHTFVALWVSLGRNAKEVSKVAGHASVAFTLDRYGHLYETDDDALADDLDRLLA